MDLPGHSIRQLAELGYPGTGAGNPTLNNARDVVAAVSTGQSGPLANRTVFLVNLFDGNIRAPLDTIAGHQIAPVWFPRDTLLGFLGNRGGGWDVWTCKPDGSDLQQRTQLHQPFPPRFDLTPELTLVAQLTDPRDHGVDLFELTLAGDTVRRLTTTTNFEETWPSISPDGATIAYNSTPVENRRAVGVSRVWLVNRDGSNPRPLLPLLRVLGGAAPQFVQMHAQNTAPSWTPDGTFVLVDWGIDSFVWTDGRALAVQGEVYAIRVADGLAIRLTRSALIDGQPVIRW